MHFLIVDDHPLLRHGARQVIARHWPDASVHEAGTLAECEAVLARQTVDCMILDLSLDDAIGLDGLARVRRRSDAPPVLVLSAHSEAAYAAKAMCLGAAGYLNKRCSGGDLVKAMELALSGSCYITPGLATRMASLLSGGAASLQPHETLSEQEFRVLLMLASGKSVSQAAGEMCLSVKTVSTYRGRILEKMQLDSNADMTRYALMQGLIKL